MCFSKSSMNGARAVSAVCHGGAKSITGTSRLRGLATKSLTVKQPSSSNRHLNYSTSSRPFSSWKPRCIIASRETRRTASASATSNLKNTALYDLHLSHGAKMVPFAGYNMPVQYSDLAVGESHRWTREKASLFDVGHMSVSVLLDVLFCRLYNF